MASLTPKTAVGIDQKRYARIKLVSEALSTHPGVRKGAIKPEVIKKAAQFAVDNAISDDAVALFVIHASKNLQTGRSSFTFNAALDSLLGRTGVSVEEFKKFLDQKERFPELYDNPYLSDDEKKEIQKIMDREYRTVKTLLGRLDDSVAGIPIIPLLVGDADIDEIINVEKKKDNGDIANTTLYTQCFSNICILDGDIQRAPNTAKEFFMPDIVEGMMLPQTFCFEPVEIIRAIAEGDGKSAINPKTGKKFSDTAFKMINRQYETEAKMYKRYKEGASKTPSATPSIVLLPSSPTPRSPTPMRAPSPLTTRSPSPIRSQASPFSPTRSPSPSPIQRPLSPTRTTPTQASVRSPVLFPTATQAPLVPVQGFPSVQSPYVPTAAPTQVLIQTPRGVVPVQTSSPFAQSQPLPTQGVISTTPRGYAPAQAYPFTAPTQTFAPTQTSSFVRTSPLAAPTQGQFYLPTQPSTFSAPTSTTGSLSNIGTIGKTLAGMTL